MDEKAERCDEVLDGVIVQTRADQAYELRLKGLSLSEVATELGYRSELEVLRAINERFAYLARDLTQEERRSILGLEMARLDKLQTAFWESAMYGDPKAGEMVLKIIDKRAKLTGVDQPDAQVNQQTVLVIGGAEADYIEKLKQLTEDAPKELPGAAED